MFFFFEVDLHKIERTAHAFFCHVVNIHNINTNELEYLIIEETNQRSGANLKQPMESKGSRAEGSGWGRKPLVLRKSDLNGGKVQILCFLFSFFFLLIFYNEMEWNKSKIEKERERGCGRERKRKRILNISKYMSRGWQQQRKNFSLWNTFKGECIINFFFSFTL